MIDVSAVLRSRNRDIWPRAACRARLAGASDYPESEKVSRKGVHEIACRAEENAVTWHDFKVVGGWFRVRTTKAIAGTPTHLKLDETRRGRVLPLRAARASSCGV